MSETEVAMASKFQGVFANKTFAKGKLKLFPMGTITRVKPEDMKASATTMSTGNSIFSISNPKVDLPEKTGMAVPYFHVQGTADPLLVTMEKATFSQDGYHIPFLRNKEKVSQGTLLLWAKDDPEKSKAAKRPRTT